MNIKSWKILNVGQVSYCKLAFNSPVTALIRHFDLGFALNVAFKLSHLQVLHLPCSKHDISLG